MTNAATKTSDAPKVSEPARPVERERRPYPNLTGDQANVLALQRAAGNRAVSAYLSGGTASASEPEDEASPSVYKTLERGSGQRLDLATRRWMEARFGEDFDQVRVHTGAQAAESAKEAKAKAYTVGKDIVFGQGNYQPETASGKHLIAHELAHVIQQGDRSDHHGKQATRLAIGQRTDPLEQEAEGAAAQVVQGRDHGSVPESIQLAPQITPASREVQTVLRYPDVEPDMIEGDKKRNFTDPNTGLERKVYDPKQGGYAKNPSATELSSVVKNGKVGGGFENGKFMYVVDENGKVIVGKRMGESMPHPTLIGGQNPKIQAAGTVEIQGGKIVSFDNHSGHYKPPRASLKSAVKSFMKLDAKVFKNLKVLSFHVEQGKETFKRFYSARLLKLKKFDIQRVLKKFRWASIKGRMRSRGFRKGAKATAAGIAGLLAIILAEWLLSKYLEDFYQRMEEEQIKRHIEKEEPKVRATLEMALEAKMDELDALLEKNPDAKIYVNVRYRLGRGSSIHPSQGGGYDDLRVAELQFVDAGFSNTPWIDKGGVDEEYVACFQSKIEWQPVILSEEIPVKELFEYEEETVQKPEQEPVGEK